MRPLDKYLIGREWRGQGFFGYAAQSAPVMASRSVSASRATIELGATGGDSVMVDTTRGRAHVDRPGFFGGTFLPDAINLPFFPAPRSSFPHILSGECTCRRSAGARCYTSQPIP